MSPTPAAAPAVAAIRRGDVVLLPTDTVYGLAADGRSMDAARRLYALKGRDAIQPTAILLASTGVLRREVPGLSDEVLAAADAVLPGGFTLVLPNPERRFAWLNGRRPDAIGIRVPALAGVAREVLDEVGVLVATSANLPGGEDPRSLSDVPAELRDGVEVSVDGGELPGRPSTVVDLTGAEPVVLREGAVPAAEALARISAAGGPRRG